MYGNTKAHQFYVLLCFIKNKRDAQDAVFNVLIFFI